MRFKSANANASEPAVTPSEISRKMCCFMVGVLTKSDKIQKVTDTQTRGEPRYKSVVKKELRATSIASRLS